MRPALSHDTVLCHRQLRTDPVWFGCRRLCAVLDFHSKLKRQEEESPYFPAKGTETQGNAQTVKAPNSHWNQADLSSFEDKNHSELTPKSALGWACLNFLVRILTTGSWPFQSTWEHSRLSRWQGGKGHVFGEHIPPSLIQSSWLPRQESSQGSRIPWNSAACHQKSYWTTLPHWSPTALPTEVQWLLHI